MDRAHRQELKHDKFVEQVGHTVEYAAHHRKQVITWAAIAFGILFAGLGVYWYMQHQTWARQQALNEAIAIDEAVVGPAPNEFIKAFPTQAEKEKAVAKAWQDLADKYPGSNEAMLAHYYLGVDAADTGKIAEAEKHFKTVVDNGKDAYASQAALALARIYHASGRTGEAEKLLRDLIANPTIMVSKEQATLLLGEILAKSKPAEARKLLEPLRTERGAVSRAALTTLNEIPR